MAQIIIKKRAQPITMEIDRAKTLKNRKYGYAGVKKADDTDHVDLGEWAGQYGDIISIDISIDRPTDKVVTKYSNEECKLFQKQIEQYLDKKGEFTLDGEMRFLSDQKVISFRKNIEGEVMIASDFHFAVVRERVIEYREFTEKIDAWRDYKCRYDYAKKKELEEREDQK